MLVSVLIPFYNSAQYLAECVDSVLNQTYDNIEIVLVDDGSTDDSLSIATKRSETDERIKLIHQQNKGFSGARNEALANATGDFVCFVDSDDSIEPYFVDYFLSIQEQTNADFVFSFNCFTTYDSSQIGEDKISRIDSDTAIAEFFYPRIRIGVWNKMFNRQFLVQNGLSFVDELTTGEGLQFITSAAAHTDFIGCGLKKAYHYRLNNPNSATSKTDVKRQGMGSVRTMDYIKSHLSIQSPKVERAFYWQYWSCYRYCLRQIYESCTKDAFPNLYRECISRIRSYALSAFFADVPLRSKFVALGCMISPITMTYFASQSKKKRLSDSNDA
jgi:glycosyltransferase involved in cell wall biosynthesis